MSTERAQLVTDVLLPRQKGDNDHLFIIKTTVWWPETLHTSLSLCKASARTTHSASTSTWGQWNTEKEFNGESNHRLREQKWEIVLFRRQDCQVALFNFLLILEHISIVTPRTGEPPEAGGGWRTLLFGITKDLWWRIRLHFDFLPHHLSVYELKCSRKALGLNIIRQENIQN